MNPDIDLDYQVAVADKTTMYVPDKKLVNSWVSAALDKAGFKPPSTSLCVRIVEEDEIISLNHGYRNIKKSTNVLSFPYERQPDVELELLGDVVACAAVINSEAEQQSKTLEQHWAHIIIHGVLHLLGYDHIKSEQAEEMESLEVDILSKLGIPNPYGEINPS